MTDRRHRLGLAALLFLGCNNGSNASSSARPDATTARRADSAAAASAGNSGAAGGTTPGNGAPGGGAEPVEPPENLLLTLRGATMRRALPVLFPQGSPAEVAEQLASQITPGIADHGDEIDVDSPFAAAGMITGDNQSTLTLFVAWPLRPGMQIAQDARGLHGWRRVSEGLYAPTSPDAGAHADDRCWVGQRAPVGWMLLCGPGIHLPLVAPYLRQAANAADNTNVVDFDVRAAMVGRLTTRQLAELDRQAPPRAETGVEGARRAMFEEVRRSAQLLSSVSNDVSSLHGTLTQDENAMHLRADLVMQRATSDQTRALIAASADRQAAASLIEGLPAAIQGYIVSGFDRAQATTALGEPQPDPRVAVQAGPEVARVLTLVDVLRGMTPLGERIDAYSNEEGYTLYHVVRRTDGQRVVNDLRAAINSMPSRPLPQGGNLRDIATVMPTPGLAGEQYLRVGRNVFVPPGHTLTPEERAEIERSMLVVAESDRLVVIAGHDPIARYRAIVQGEHLHGTIPANAVMYGHITPPSFIPLFYGATIPQLPPSRTTDPLDFSVRVERRGEGAHAELRADAPIGAAMEIRTLYAMVQELQAQMMQRMMQAQQQAAQQQQGGGMPGGMARPRPRVDPSMLPPPPNVQLSPPPP